MNNRNSRIVVKAAELTRLNDTTTYASGDSFNETTPRIIEFTNVVTRESDDGWITKLVAKKNNPLVSSASFELHLYDTAITPIADNAPLTRLYANKEFYLGSIEFSFLASPTGSNCAVKTVMNIDMPFTTKNTRSIYGVLEVKGAYLPIANEKIYLALTIEQYI